MDNFYHCLLFAIDRVHYIKLIKECNLRTDQLLDQLLILWVTNYTYRVGLKTSLDCIEKLYANVDMPILYCNFICKQNCKLLTQTEISCQN